MSWGPLEAAPTNERLLAVLELELPGSEPVRSRIDDAVRVMPGATPRHVRQACDLDLRHPRSRDRPRPAIGLQHAEVGRDVHVAGVGVLYDVGQRQVAEGAVEAGPRRG